MTIRCRSCGSEDWKLARFIHESEPAGVDPSTASQSTGSFKSKIAQQAVPPLRPINPGKFKSFEEFSRFTNIKICVFIGLVVVGIFDSRTTWLQILMSPVILIVGLGILGHFGSKKVYQEDKGKHDLLVDKYEMWLEAKKVWERTRVCMRCGTFDGSLTTEE